jgi:hypothetical protein
MYPFMFAVLRADHEFDHWVVIVAHPFDYIHYEAGWMHDPEFPEGMVLVPDVDLSASEHRFASETDALKFIRDWWITHPVEG